MPAQPQPAVTQVPPQPAVQSPVPPFSPVRPANVPSAARQPNNPKDKARQALEKVKKPGKIGMAVIIAGLVLVLFGIGFFLFNTAAGIIIILIAALAILGGLFNH